MRPSAGIQLKWKSYLGDLRALLQQLRRSEELTDVVLTNGSASVRCHRVVLSAACQTFHDLLKEHAGDVVICLGGVDSSDLRSLVDYMYSGEVEVTPGRLGDFLALAAQWGVRGLEETARSARQQTEAPDALGSTSERSAKESLPRVIEINSSAASPGHDFRSADDSTSRQKGRPRPDDSDSDSGSSSEEESRAVLPGLGKPQTSSAPDSANKTKPPKVSKKTRSHHKIAPSATPNLFSCPHCSRFFVKLHFFKAHLKNNHNDQTLPEQHRVKIAHGDRQLVQLPNGVLSMQLPSATAETNNGQPEAKKKKKKTRAEERAAEAAAVADAADAAVRAALERAANRSGAGLSGATPSSGSAKKAPAKRERSSSDSDSDSDSSVEATRTGGGKTPSGPVAASIPPRPSPAPANKAPTKRARQSSSEDSDSDSSVEVTKVGRGKTASASVASSAPGPAATPARPPPAPAPPLPAMQAPLLTHPPAPPHVLWPHAPEGFLISNHPLPLIPPMMNQTLPAASDAITRSRIGFDRDVKPILIPSMVGHLPHNTTQGGARPAASAAASDQGRDERRPHTVRPPGDTAALARRWPAESQRRDAHGAESDSSRGTRIKFDQEGRPMSGAAAPPPPAAVATHGADSDSGRGTRIVFDQEGRPRPAGGPPPPVGIATHVRRESTGDRVKNRDRDCAVHGDRQDGWEDREDPWLRREYGGGSPHSDKRRRSSSLGEDAAPLPAGFRSQPGRGRGDPSHGERARGRGRGDPSRSWRGREDHSHGGRGRGDASRGGRGRGDPGRGGRSRGRFRGHHRGRGAV